MFTISEVNILSLLFGRLLEWSAMCQRLILLCFKALQKVQQTTCFHILYQWHGTVCQKHNLR